MTNTVSEKQARQVAEEAREQSWVQPSFGKELFLGRLRLDLIHPYPQPTPESREKGEAFVKELTAAGGTAHFVELDVVNQDQWDGAVGRVRTSV